MELLDHLVSQEGQVNQGPQDLLDLLVTPVKMGNPDLLVCQVIPVKMAKTVIPVDLAQLDPLDSLDTLVNLEHQDIPEQKG